MVERFEMLELTFIIDIDGLYEIYRAIMPALGAYQSIIDETKAIQEGLYRYLENVECREVPDIIQLVYSVGLPTTIFEQFEEQFYQQCYLISELIHIQIAGWIKCSISFAGDSLLVHTVKYNHED